MNSTRYTYIVLETLILTDAKWQTSFRSSKVNEYSIEKRTDPVMDRQKQLGHQGKTD